MFIPPPCTLDAWTSGPIVVCCLCILVPVTHMPRGRTKAPTERELAKVSVGDFTILALVGSTQATTLLWPVKPPWTHILSHTEC